LEGRQNSRQEIKGLRPIFKLSLQRGPSNLSYFMQILIIEDDARMADLLRRTFEEEGYTTFNAYDSEQALKLAAQKDLQLIVSDVMLPGMDGISLCKQLKQNHPNTPVIMLTALGNTDDKLEGFDAGADDYMVKPFEIRELLARAKALIHRYNKTTQPNPSQYSCADLSLDKLSKTVKRAGKSIELTPKEYKLLAFLLENQGRVLSKSEIATQVWETHYDTGTNFIDVYINYLRNKIDKPFKTKLLHTRKGLGFVLQEEVDK